MKWLDNFIRRAYIRARDSECCEEVAVCGSDMDQPNRLQSRYNSNTHTRFNLFSADGGFIIETVSRDNKSHEDRTQLYVIRDEDDLAESLQRIIILERLKY